MADAAAYIGVGSNIAPERHVPTALDALRAAFGEIVCSPAYRSPPLGFEGSDFINCVVRIDSHLEVPDLIARLKTLESRAGRQTRTAPGSRELDLDLLLYDDRVIDLGAIRLPRPDVLDYAFVLRPLADLAPALVHPVTGRSLAWHWAHFEGDAVALTPVALDNLDGAIQRKREEGEEWSG